MMVSRQKSETRCPAARSRCWIDNMPIAILLLSSEQLTGFTTHHAILLEPRRIIPTAGGIDRRWAPGGGDRAGGRDRMPDAAGKVARAGKGAMLRAGEIRLPASDGELSLFSGKKRCWSRAPTMLVLDCLGYYQHHRDVLQKALDVPVLLSDVLVSRLAAELLV
ncbi:AroM family protein [Klebsiella pneumoniae]|nr:AroM family protein [Klebsiella pneumoniae]